MKIHEVRPCCPIFFSFSPVFTPRFCRSRSLPYIAPTYGSTLRPLCGAYPRGMVPMRALFKGSLRRLRGAECARTNTCVLRVQGARGHGNAPRCCGAGQPGGAEARA